MTCNHCGVAIEKCQSTEHTCDGWIHSSSRTHACSIGPGTWSACDAMPAVEAS